MHPRSRYKDNPPSFSLLAQRFPPLNPYILNHGRSIDFHHPDAVRELARALLFVDFGLSVKLPANRLCPMVPNRLNYILFLQDLIGTTSRESWNLYPEKAVVGLDIGTGASCIYPLLAVRERPSWSMIASELDENSRLYALRNVTENNLDKKIKVIAPTLDPDLDIDSPTILPLPGFIRDQDPASQNREFLFDFTMVNPPFYDSNEELLESAEKKKLPPNSACTGAPNEMIYEQGGERGFIKQKILESLQERNRNYARWFTSLCGKKSTPDYIVDVFRSRDIKNFLVRKLETGDSGTVRWVVAWSLADRHPPPWLVKGNGIKKEWQPESGELHFRIPKDLEETKTQLNKLLSTLSLFKFNWSTDDGNAVWGKAPGDCWSRKYRRSAQKGQEAFAGKEDHIGVRIYVGDEEFKHDGEEANEGGGTADLEAGGTAVNIYWTEGKNRVIFDSFSGMVKRGLSEAQ